MGFKKIIAATMTVGMVMSFIPATVMADRPGWDLGDDGYWSYYTSETEYVTGWKYIGSYWYWFDDDGDMACSTWRLLKDGDGQDYWYHFDKNGHMEKNKWIEDKGGDGDPSYWSYLDGKGHSVMGWYKVKGVWYYFDPDEDGCMAADVMVKDTSGDYYFFNSNGSYLKNKWKKVDGYWYYFTGSGAAAKGWKKISGKWYYFDPESAYMYADRGLEDNGKRYIFGADGAMVTGWYKWKMDEEMTIWFYAGSDGVVYRNKWLQSKGIWYYFDNNSVMVFSNTDYEINGRFYDFAESGALLKPYNGRSTPSAM